MIWNVNPILLDMELGPLHLQIRWYGLFFALAFLLGHLVMRFIFRRENKPLQDLDPLLWYLVAGVVIGARLGHCLFYEPEYYLKNPLEILKVWRGGLASHGGVFGVLVSLYFYSRKRDGQSYLWILDRVGIAVPLGGAMVRLGNLFNSEIIGRMTDVTWAFYFLRIDRVSRHPTQIYESIAYLCCFCCLFFCYRRLTMLRDSQDSPASASTRKSPGNGLYFGMFLVLVFGVRFFIEFFKEPQVDFESTMLLDMGQLLSIPFVFVGVVLMVRSLRKEVSQIASSSGNITSEVLEARSESRSCVL